MSTPKTGDLKVWWCPQIPCKAFHVLVDSVEEGVKILDLLAQYDQFQLENRIKPDYANVGGLLMYRPDLREPEEDSDERNDWTDWYYEHDDDYFDDPREYLAWVRA